MNVHLRTIISLLLTINFPLGLVGVHIPEVREISSSTAKNSNELFIDPNQRIVDNSIIRLRWDLNNPEFIKEFIYKPLDPNLNLTSYWTGSGAFDDEFLGNSWSIDDPQSGGIVVVGRGQIGTWSVVTDTLGAANVTITSVGSQGFPITTTYRIEADSPQIQVQRVFGFSSKPLSTTMGFRPYMFRVSRSLGFDQYVMPLTNGSIITGSATTCPYGCNRIDWAGTWADLLAPSLCPDGIGIALINLTKTSPGIWVDHDLNSNSAYIAATPLNNSEYLNYNVSVTYRYCVHTGNFQDAKECSASQPFLDLPFSHSPGDDGFDWIYSFFDHEYPIYTSEPSTAADSIVIFSGARRTIGKKCVGGLNCYSGHDGYDFSVSEGSPVLAAHGGWAAGTQWTCKGSTPINVVSVTQGRYQTVYLHLQGDSYWQSLKNNPRLVRLGDRIGTVGNSGSPNCSTGPHLHFGLYYDTNNDGKFSSSEKVDPYGFITTQEDPWTTYRDSHPISEWMWAFNPSAQTTINPNSGLVLASGNINVNVPFGSVSDPTLLSLMLVPEPTNRSTILTETSDKHKETTLEPLDVGYTFQLSAVSENSTPLTSFNKGITITVPYTDININYVDENTLRLYRWQETSSLWMPITTTLFTSTKKVLAVTDSPGLFSLRGEALNPSPILLTVSPSIIESTGVTTIVVKGENFLPTPKLNLDITSLNVDFVSTSTLTATVPSTINPGIYTITLRNPDGQIVNLPNAITIPFSIYLPNIISSPQSAQ